MAVEVNIERKGVEVTWDPGDFHEEVTVYALGDDEEWHNTAAIANDGKALISYPADFAGESLVEVRAADGTIVDSGTIEIS